MDIVIGNGHSALKGFPYDVMVNMQDCEIIESEFKLQSCYYIHFRTNNLEKSMNLLILPAMG